MDAHTTTVVRTVGHSNLPLEGFLHLLRAHSVTLVVDVRKMPGSRRNAQFTSNWSRPHCILGTAEHTSEHLRRA